MLVQLALAFLLAQPAAAGPAGIPDPPQSFNNVTSPDEPGIYLFGSENFHVREVPVTGLLHRSMAGPQEDFVLGVISVLLIALLSEIVQTVLMRTRQNRVTRSGLHTAVVLDEVYHFRNVCSLLSRDPTCRNDSRRRRLAVNSLIIVSLAAALLAAEVFAVYLTQPVRMYTTRNQYNLKGLQPAGTSLKMATHIDHLTKKKRCITPSMSHSNQSREYSLNACIMRTFDYSMMNDDEEATWVKVGSWFHKAGSDHEITFGDGVKTGRHELETRATIMQGNEGITKFLLFEVNDTEDMAHAQYLQKYLLYTAVKWNCEKKVAGQQNCDDLTEQLEPVDAKRQRRPVVFFERNDAVEEEGNPTGIVTEFKLRLKQPFDALEAALHVFATSAVIEEVLEGEGEGEGKYVTKSGETEYGIGKLVSEEGRVAGIVLLSVVFVVLLVVLILLRVCLKPISLARIARSTVDEDDMEAAEEVFVGAGKQRGGSTSSMESPPSPKGMKKFLNFGRNGRKEKERVTDLADFESEGDDYHSTVTFEGASD